MSHPDRTVFQQEKLPGYYDKPCSLWQRLPYRSDTGGVAPMFLEGIEKYTNHRINGTFTPERRAWRKQWKHDQHLSPREPVFVPELDRVLNNPIKRFFRWPGMKIEQLLIPVVGKYFASGTRNFLRLSVKAVILTYGLTYFFMYHQRNWEKYGSIRGTWQKPVVYPGQPGYPFVSTAKLDEHHDMEFNQSPLYKSAEQIRAEYAAELAQKAAARK